MFSNAMNDDDWRRRGARAVAALEDLSPVEQRFIRAFRAFCSEGRGPGEMRGGLFCDFIRETLQAARRPIMHHHVDCTCVGADEACLAAYVDAAAIGADEDAALAASLILRPDMSIVLVPMAAEVGRLLAWPGQGIHAARLAQGRPH